MYGDIFVFLISGHSACLSPKEGGQEVVSGQGHAIVAARRGRGIALCRASLWRCHSIARPGSTRAARDQVSGTFMPQKVRIALDAMGGDVGASVVIPGAAISLKRHPDSEFLFYGDSKLIDEQLAKYPALQKASHVVHTDVTVSMHDKPSQALRRGRKNSSMWLAIDAVKKGEADVAVSAGNTGALMFMAKFNLKTMAGIERPAIAGFWPTLKGESIVLDVGASIGADAQHIVDMAVMGGALARIVFDLERPKVGLLNIGVEEIKGLEEVRDAGRILREARLPDFEYVGFIEGNDIGKGVVDVVVTEGFAGNIAIKAAEGTARQFAELLKRAMSRSWQTK